MAWSPRLTRSMVARNWWSSLFGSSRIGPTVESVCFFVPTKSKGWILEAACREIASRLETPSQFCESYKALPKATAYFFCHYHFYLSALKLHPWLADENCIVWFTHPQKPDLGPATVNSLRSATVVTMCSRWRDYLIEQGLEAERVKTIVGAADPEFFQPHHRGGGKVGFCTAYYERKGPDRILDLVKLLPEYQFVLLGRNWEQYPRFDELRSLANLEYREAAYHQYPAFYSELDVFVSASLLEGGPIPLLESMMSNVVPVASDTGFAPDVISHGENGFLYPAEERNTTVIAQLVRQAMHLEGDVRNSVLPFSWNAYAMKYSELFKAA